MKLLLVIFSCTFLSHILTAQQISYKYDKANRLVEVSYPSQLKTKYTYDKDGNRISVATSRIDSSSTDTTHTIVNPVINNQLAKQNVWIYPNPSDGPAYPCRKKDIVHYFIS